MRRTRLGVCKSGLIPEFTCTIQSFCAVDGLSDGGAFGSKVLRFTVWLATDSFGNGFGVCLVTGTVASFWGGTGFIAAAAPAGLGVAEIANFCFSSGLSAW